MIPMRSIFSPLPLLLLLLTSVSAGCITSNKVVVGSVPPGGAPAPEDYEVLGETYGSATTAKFLGLSGSAWDCGFLASEGTEPLVRPHWIGIGPVDAVVDYILGSDHLIEVARREAMFQALAAFPEADTVLFPRYEIESLELIFVPGLASLVDVNVSGLAIRWKRGALPPESKK